VITDDVVSQAEQVVEEYDAFWDRFDAWTERFWDRLDDKLDRIWGDDDADR